MGTGIGLSLTQSIVNLHHGIIEVASNEPHGTIFEVIIPVSKGVYDESCFAAEEEERIVEDVIPPTAKLPLMNAEKKWTVLLAEDNNEVRNYVKECLEPYYYVLEADNGEDAFNICVEKYPDLILSDIMMPRMDGLELLYAGEERPACRPYTGCADDCQIDGCTYKRRFLRRC